MLKNIALLLLMSALLACNKNQEPDYSQRTSYFKNITPDFSQDSIIKCVTYNIKMGFGLTKDAWDKDVIGSTSEDIEAIAQILEQLNPNIIALQEVHRNRSNAEVKNLLEALANRLQMNYAFGAHGYNDPYGVVPTYGEWGNAILTKFKIESLKNIETEYVNVWERRSMVDAVVRINDTLLIHAFSLHHLPSDDGIPNTAAYVKTLSAPAIVMGDFNYIGPILPLEDLGLIEVDSLELLHGVDRILVSGDVFMITDMGQLNDTIGASDHLANYGILKLK